MLKHHFELENVELEVLTLKTLVKFELDRRDVLCFSTSKTSTRYEISEKIAHSQMLEEAFDANSNKDWISMQATCVTLKMQTQFVRNRRFIFEKSLDQKTMKTQACKGRSNELLVENSKFIRKGSRGLTRRFSECCRQVNSYDRMITKTDEVEELRRDQQLLDIGVCRSWYETFGSNVLQLWIIICSRLMLQATNGINDKVEVYVWKNQELVNNRKVFVTGDEQRRRCQRETEQIPVVQGMQNPDHGFSVGCNLRARRQVTLVRWRTKDSKSIEEPLIAVQIDIGITFGSRKNFSRGNWHLTTSETCLSRQNGSGLNC